MHLDIYQHFYNLNDNDAYVLMDYWTNTWISYNALFPFRIWSHHDNNGARTNNNLEGWHNGFRIRVGNHPRLYRFIHHIITVQNETNRQIKRLLKGDTPKKQSKLYRSINEKIVLFKQQVLSNERSVEQFLDAASHLVKQLNPEN